MPTTNPTFSSVVPAYFLGRPRSVYEARYQRPRPQATIAAIAAIAPAPTVSQAA